MNWKETGFVTLNAAILAVAYTIIGVVLSFVLHYLFDEYNENWKKRSTLYQVADVSVEISLLSVIAFWSIHVIEISPPFIPVRKQLDLLVDGYISGIFYIFAVFVFMDDLTDKLKYIFKKNISPIFEITFPTHGSIVDMNLSYGSRKTDKD